MRRITNSSFFFVLLISILSLTGCSSDNQSEISLDKENQKLVEENENFEALAERIFDLYSIEVKRLDDPNSFQLVLPNSTKVSVEIDLEKNIARLEGPKFGSEPIFMKHDLKSGKVSFFSSEMAALNTSVQQPGLLNKKDEPCNEHPTETYDQCIERESAQFCDGWWKCGVQAYAPLISYASISAHCAVC